MRSKSPALMDKIVKLIDSEYCKHGRVPTMREIAASLKISKSCVSNYIKEMKSKNLVEKSNCWRGVSTEFICKSTHDICYLPVIKNLFDESYLETTNISKYLPISKELIDIGNYFIFEVHENISVGFSDGDFIIVKQQHFAEEGQIIVLKENKSMVFVRYRKGVSDIQIFGIAVRVIKKLA